MYQVRFYITATWHIRRFRTEAQQWEFIRQCMAKGVPAARVVR